MLYNADYHSDDVELRETSRRGSRRQEQEIATPVRRTRKTNIYAGREVRARLDAKQESSRDEEVLATRKSLTWSMHADVAAELEGASDADVFRRNSPDQGVAAEEARAR